MNEKAVSSAVERMPVQSESAQVLEMISHVASDPSADIDKLERLMALHERMESARAERAFNVAMNAAQSEMGRVSADATNPQTRSKYATYGQLDRHLRPIYARHGFALSFDEGPPPAPDYVRVLCYVTHSDGYSKTYAKNMPADGKGAKGNDVMTKTHAAGAAMQYGMRYLLKGIFNVAIGEDDNDGNGAPPKTIGPGQLANLEALMSEVGADRAAFLKYLKVDALEQLPAKSYRGAVRALEAKRQKSREPGEDG